jgi:hypothetical protein
MVAFPILSLLDGEISDPQWFQDITDAVNDHETRVSTLEGIDRTPQWTVTSTSASIGATTTEAVFATAPSATYKAHTAYKIEISGYGHRSVGTGGVTETFQIRDTNTSGTVRMGGLTYGVNDTAQTPIQLFHYVANTSGSDILGRVLVATITASAGTVHVNASAQKPWYVTCIEAGVDTDFPQAVAL